jgi:hypothetical protein
MEQWANSQLKRVRSKQQYGAKKHHNKGELQMNLALWLLPFRFDTCKIK